MSRAGTALIVGVSGQDRAYVDHIPSEPRPR
jgi:hypothetical protein